MPFNIPFLPEMDHDRVSNYESSIGSIWNSIKNIYSQLNVEVKHHDYTTSLTPATIGNWYSLTDIAQGITGGDVNAIDTGYREGDKIRIRTIQVKGRANLASGAATDTVHLLVFKHYDNFLGNNPDINDVYDIHSNSNLYNRLRRPEYKGQYKLLVHKKLTISGVEDRFNEQDFNIYIKPRSRKGTTVEWEGPFTTDLSNGKYHLFLYSESGNVAVSWTSRVTYIDN